MSTSAMAPDPAEPPPISGDGHLLELAGEIPVFTPSEFLAAQG
jgi:hypothetical protein